MFLNVEKACRLVPVRDRHASNHGGRDYDVHSVVDMDPRFVLGRSIYASSSHSVGRRGTRNRYLECRAMANHRIKACFRDGYDSVVVAHHSMASITAFVEPFNYTNTDVLETNMGPTPMAYCHIRRTGHIHYPIQIPMDTRHGISPSKGIRTVAAQTIGETIHGKSTYALDVWRQSIYHCSGKSLFVGIAMCAPVSIHHALDTCLAVRHCDGWRVCVVHMFCKGHVCITECCV